MKRDQVIHQAIEREIRLGTYLLSGYADKIRSFEKKYKMKSAAFVRLFEKGQTNDEQDFFEWFAIYNGKKYWEEKLAVLKAA